MLWISYAGLLLSVADVREAWCSGSSSPQDCVMDQPLHVVWWGGLSMVGPVLLLRGVEESGLRRIHWVYLSSFLELS